MKKSELQKIQQELNQYLDAFAQNTFLIPNGWADVQQFTNREGFYKTYSDEGRHYMSFEEQSIKITVRKEKENWQISFSGSLLNAKPVSKQIKEAMELIKNIYNEVHSINPNKVKLKQIRKKITKKTEQIKDLQKEIDNLRQEIKDFKLTPLNKR